MCTKVFLIAGFLMVLHTSHGIELISEPKSSSDGSSPVESFQTGDTGFSGSNLSIGDATSIFQLFKPFRVPPPIATFVTIFDSTVKSSETLLDLFDLTEVKPSEFGKSVYEFVYKSSDSMGLLNPHFVANNISQSIASNLDTLRSSVMINLYANAMARTLFAEGILKPNNAATLAEEYANGMEAFAKKLVVKDNPLSKIQVFPAAYEKILDKVGLLTSGHVPSILFHFVNELNLVGKLIRKSSSLENA
ncbi:b6 protein [Trichonephila clavata]|uniref:B6 protein n=1 Tax=Trichonephila clavata TaxID=2740835 RepID=A0A8X6K6Q4_TRICU|nr:b6 protein [Trichonephila clavata]